jgi:hypothetical protein
VLSLTGFSQTDFSGSWNSVSLAVPSQLKLLVDYYVEGEPTVTGFATLPEFGHTSTTALSVDATGHFTGPDFLSGTVSLAGPGLVKVEAIGVMTNHLVMNAAADVMVSLKDKGEGSQHELEILLRAPTAYNNYESVSGMAGQWNFVMLRTPKQLILHQGSTNVAFSPTPLTGVVEVEGADEFGVRTGTMNLAADGSFTVDFGMGPMTGIAYRGPPEIAIGFIVVEVNTPMGVMYLNFFVNRSLDVMACVYGQGNYQELIVGVRVPVIQTVAEGKGLWRGSIFETPVVLNQPRNQFGFVRDIPEKSYFAYRSENIHAGHEGVFTLPASSGVGSFSITEPGKILAKGTNYVAGDQAWSTPLAVNAGKNVMVAIRNDGANELIIQVRAPSELYPSDNPVQGEFGLALIRTGPGNGTPTLFWASDSSRQLVRSINLTTWTEVSGTMGKHEFVPSITGAEQHYYRVKQSGP